MSGFKSWLYENDNVCFVLKGAKNLPACGRKTEKNITLALDIINCFTNQDTYQIGRSIFFIKACSLRSVLPVAFML
jgi:hypothetical protein